MHVVSDLTLVEVQRLDLVGLVLQREHFVRLEVDSRPTHPGSTAVAEHRPKRRNQAPRRCTAVETPGSTRNGEGQSVADHHDRGLSRGLRRLQAGRAGDERDWSCALCAGSHGELL